MGLWARMLAACLCGGRVKEEADAGRDGSRGQVESPVSPVPAMEPVLSIACHGSVMGQERNVFVAVKKCMLSSNVKVTQLSRPCDVLLLFHDITNGASTKQVLNKVEDAAAESGALNVVLVMMYADFNGDELAGFQASGRQRLGEKAWRRLESSVSLVVDMVYSETEKGLLDCLQNSLSLQQVVQYLKHVVRGQNAMLTGDSFTIARAIQHSTPVKKHVATPPRPQECPSSILIPAGSVQPSTRNGSSSGSGSQGSFKNTQSPQGSPRTMLSPSKSRKMMAKYQSPRQSPSRKQRRHSREHKTPPRWLDSRQGAREPRKRNKTWGGWEYTRPSKGHSKKQKGLAVDMKHKKKKEEINAVATGYPSNAPSRVKSAYYPDEKFGAKSGQAWQPASPPVFDGNCFLEMVPHQ